MAYQDQLDLVAEQLKNPLWTLLSRPSRPPGSLKDPL